MVAQLGQFAATVLNHFAVPAGTDAGHGFKLLDHRTKSQEAHEFEHELSARVVGHGLNVFVSCQSCPIAMRIRICPRSFLPVAA